MRKDEILAFNFIDTILKTQSDRIAKMTELLSKVERGEITPMEYIIEMIFPNSS